MNQGVVKQVLSGDSLVIRGQPRNGSAPMERTISLSEVTAPRLERRGTTAESRDEPFAWESREHLRRRLVGQVVSFVVDYSVSSGREFCTVFLNGKIPGEPPVNINEEMISAGLVRIRDGSKNTEALGLLQSAAQDAGKGVHSKPEVAAQHVRNVQSTFENPRAVVDSYKQQPIEAIVEHIRDSSCIRVLLLPKFQQITLSLSGIKTPGFRKGDDGNDIPEPFAEEAKFFVESRLLQREVKVILEGTTGNGNFLGTILHPVGNISEFLLKEGFAKIADWSIGNVTTGREKYRAAENLAKQNRTRQWMSYTPSQGVLAISEKTFSGVVEEIVNVDTLVMSTAKGERRVVLSSLRPPRAKKEDEGPPAAPKARSLFDVPYFFEAREFLRKKLIGQKVQVEVDYVKPAENKFPEKICGTVMFEGINMAEALISKGFATVLRHKGDDDARSAKFDDLLAAETRAIKNQKGLHNPKDTPVHRVTEINSKVIADRFLPSLKRSGRQACTVEYVSSGSRLRVHIPKDSCFCVVIIAGITCPRTGMGDTPGEPFGSEAFAFTKSRALQREVEVEVYDVDKNGNFIGSIYIKNTSLSVLLLEQGLSSLHSSADRYSGYAALAHAEQSAKDARLGLFASYDPVAIEAALAAARIAAAEPVIRAPKYSPIIVTEVAGPTTLWIQSLTHASELTTLMADLEAYFHAHPHTPGAFTARKGDLCASQFSVDRTWYRVRVLSIVSKKAEISYVDFGNTEFVDVALLAALPPGTSSLSPQARQVKLALVADPPADYLKEATQYLTDGIINAKFLCNTEYRDASFEYISLINNEEEKQDVTCTMLYAGYVLVAKRRESYLQDMQKAYTACQDEAKGSRLGMWRYGDVTVDDERDFRGPPRR